MVCKYVDLVRQRQARDLDRQRSASFPFRYDESEAKRACEFFPDMLKHWKGPLAGQAFELSDWQSEEVVGPLFGWKRLDGTRRFRTAWIEVPRKNGKSTTGAGFAYQYTMEEAGGEVYSIATKKDQARIVWETARKMLNQSPRLDRLFDGYAHSIVCPKRNAYFKPLGADSDTLDGLNPYAVLADEIHAWRDRHLWDVMETGMVGRIQGMMMALTTAGVCKPESIGWELHNRAKAVLDGVAEDEELFAFIAHADEDDDFEDPAVWRKANPNLGVSVFEDRIAKALEKAKSSPAFLDTFLRYHLNIWTAEAKKAIPLEKWNENAGKFPDLSGQPCWAGLDLSAKIDLTALVLVFRVEDKYYVKPYFWLPETTIAGRSKSVPYQTWVKRGHIEVTPGSIVDYQFVQQRVKELAKKYKIREIAFDPWGGWETASRLQDAGFKMVECRQGYKTLSEPTKLLIGLVGGKNFVHDGNPVLTWCAHNLVLREDANQNVAPDKGKSPEKIDGIVAAIMGLSRAMHRKESVYSKRGLRTIG